MSSRFQTGEPRSAMPRFSARQPIILAALAALALTACQRESREPRGAPLPETSPKVTVTDLYPGQPSPPTPDPRGKSYEGNAYHVSQGSRLFRWYNCNGCHANGGGGMGPPLMDDQWRYGGSIDQIYSTIAQGRPNGMPSFGAKVPSSQIWELAAYVRSLSGNAPSNAEFSRRDAMTNISPRSQTRPETPKTQNPAATQVPSP
jgi:cytochrome c oxidase cbb3-type subunit 3